MPLVEIFQRETPLTSEMEVTIEDGDVLPHQKDNLAGKPQDPKTHMEDKCPTELVGPWQFLVTPVGKVLSASRRLNRGDRPSGGETRNSGHGDSNFRGTGADRASTSHPLAK